MGYAQRAAHAWAGLVTAVAGVSAVAVFGLAAPASADVTIDSEQGQRLGGARIALRVTNEHPTATITKVEVHFPSDITIPEIYPIAVADWAPSITMTKVDDNPANDRSSAVTWITMPGKEIKPGATSLLPLAMGPMPDREVVYLDVVQTRSDGTTERWAGVDTPVAGAQHTAFPLKLEPLPPGQAPLSHHGGAASPGAQADVAADPVAADDSEASEGSGGARLAVALLLIAALTVFALFWQRRRRLSGGDDDRASARRGRNTPAPASAKAAKPVPAKAKAAPVKAAPVKAAKATPAKGAPAKVVPATAKAATAAPVDETADVAAAASAPVVQRRTVVRGAAARKATDRRRTVVRKSGAGGSATATIARRRGNASNRPVESGSDNA